MRALVRDLPCRPGSDSFGEVRHAFVHEAILTMGAAGDERAPGAAITIALCGRLDHEPPCPLAPHHTAA